MTIFYCLYHTDKVGRKKLIVDSKDKNDVLERLNGEIDNSFFLQSWDRWTNGVDVVEIDVDLVS